MTDDSAERSGHDREGPSSDLDPTDDPADGLAVVASVWDVLEADIIAAKLRDTGIESAVRSESLSTVMGLTVDGLGRRDVLVRAGDADEAGRIISEQITPEQITAEEVGGPSGEDEGRREEP